MSRNDFKLLNWINILRVCTSQHIAIARGHNENRLLGPIRVLVKSAYSIKLSFQEVRNHSDGKFEPAGADYDHPIHDEQSVAGSTMNREIALSRKCAQVLATERGDEHRVQYCQVSFQWYCR